MGLNPDFRRQWPTTSCLNDGTTFSVIIGHAQSAGVGLAQSVQWVGEGMDYREVTLGFPCGGKKSLSSPQRPWRFAWPCSFLSKVLRGKTVGAWSKPLKFVNVKNTWSYNFASQCGFILSSFIFPWTCLGYYTCRCLAFLTAELDRAESFLRSWYLNSISRNPQQHVEPKDSLQ